MTAQYVYSIEREEHHLSPVPRDDLQIWETIEDARQDEPEKLDTSLAVPTDAGTSEKRLHFRSKSGVLHVQHSLPWRLRV